MDVISRFGSPSPELPRRAEIPVPEASDGAFLSEPEHLLAVGTEEHHGPALEDGNTPLLNVDLPKVEVAVRAHGRFVVPFEECQSLGHEVSDGR